MKRLVYPAMIAILIGTSAFTVVNNTSEWKVKDDAYSVSFTSSKFEGSFRGLKSELYFDETNLAASRITATIDASTINTGNGMRNGHAKKGLDVEAYQTVKFVSTSIIKTSNGYSANGNLTIKDVTRPVVIPFTFNKTAEGGVFAGTFTVKPSDYNVTKSGTPEVMDFQLNVPVSK